MTETKTKKTVEDNLKDLFELQLIDRKLDKIRAVRGELPMEVEDLEDEVTGLKTRVEKLDNKISDLQESIDEKKKAIKEAEDLKKKYESQQDDVKNNREYMALSKEIELQELEVMAAQKKIKDFESEMSELQTKKEEAGKAVEEKEEELKEKKEELDNIIAETEKEEQHYLQLREEAVQKLDERHYDAYTRIRNTFKNGLAVVTINRDSCGGCFSDVPPQRQLDVGHRKRIIICENCGRILIDQELANQAQENIGIEV